MCARRCATPISGTGKSRPRPRGSGRLSARSWIYRTTADILVPAGDREHAEAKHRRQRVDHPLRVAPLPDAARYRPVGIARARFIPASAGNRGCCRTCCPPASVHPRERGEQADPGSVTHRSRGSSPRARGTGRSGKRHASKSRFIPASAGNRPSTTPRTTTTPVHPRERGEQSVSCSSWASCIGSSPRARGTEAAGTLVGRLDRFIPASAGNSRPPHDPRLGIPVHPRERGEQLPHPAAQPIGVGSSPRARGTEPIDHQSGLKRRFIPASAGNSPAG